MASHTTRWRLDSCECEVEFTWDDTVPAANRTHTISQVLRRCLTHAALTDPATHFSVLLDENPRKNHALDRVRKVLNATDDQMATVGWSFSGSNGARVLTVVIPFATAGQKTAMQAWCDTNLGVGKVVVT